MAGRSTIADKKIPLPLATNYDAMLSGVVELLEQARRTSARAVNTIMTATYWEIGRRIVEHEQLGKNKADYGKQVIDRLAADLTEKLGRGFGRRNLFQMRLFYTCFPNIVQTVSAQFEDRIIQTLCPEGPCPGPLCSGESAQQGACSGVQDGIA